MKTQTKQEARNIIAVYGTLKRGYGNNRIIEDSEYLGEFISDPIFTMYNLGGFPALTKDGNTSITIQVYSVDNYTLERVYNLEGYSGQRDYHDNWYDTLDIETPWGTAEMFYFKEKPNNKIVETGNWGDFE